MRSLNFCLVLTGSFIIATSSQAFVNIEDFRAGSFEETLFGNGTIQKEQYDLDKSHTFFGDRFTRLEIGSNRVQDAVTLRVGDGEARVTSDSQKIATTLNFDYGFSQSALLDISQETEIWVDTHTEGPSDRIADFHVLFVRDTNGISDITPVWSQRQGGIRFKKSTFDPRIDWSRIEYLNYEVRYSAISGPHPLISSTGRIYAVPEPGSLLVLGVAAGAMARRYSKRRGGTLMARPHSAFQIQPPDIGVREAVRGRQSMYSLH